MVRTPEKFGGLGLWPRQLVLCAAGVMQGTFELMCLIAPHEYGLS